MTVITLCPILYLGHSCYIQDAQYDEQRGSPQLFQRRKSDPVQRLQVRSEDSHNLILESHITAVQPNLAQGRCFLPLKISEFLVLAS